MSLERDLNSRMRINERNRLKLEFKLEFKFFKGKFKITSHGWPLDVGPVAELLGEDDEAGDGAEAPDDEGPGDVQDGQLLRVVPAPSGYSTIALMIRHF